MEEKKTNQDMEELKDEELEAASGGFIYLIDPKIVHCRGCGQDFLVSDPSTFTCPECGYKR